jgi:chromosomal replication initiation ATPase DnaA
MNLAQLLPLVAAKHGLNTWDLFARTRSVAVTDARAEYFFRALSETPTSSVEVGRFLGKDHATVLYGAARYAVKHGLPIPRGAKPNNYLRWHGPRLDVIA